MLRRFVPVLAGLLVVAGLGAPAGAPAAEGECPNEALRVELGEGALPDCRAWEMVTPPFKSSQDMRRVQAVSSDGSRVLVGAQGFVAGAGGVAGSGVEFFYVMERSGSGWVTSPVDPPASLLPSAGLGGVSADLGRTLWTGRGWSQPSFDEDLYVRDGGGPLVKVGPMVPPVSGPPGGVYANSENSVASGYGGVSGDLSHVLFVGRGPLWPGDTTVGGPFSQSLYEYVGTGNSRPVLVGVNDEGRLISDCGTTLGSIEGSYSDSFDTYNAVSGSGETVFFTARAAGGGCGGAGPLVNEVYARVGQFPIDTVAISEPTFGDCERCQTGVATPLSPAVPVASAEFQGASEDGSRVFFLTEQELLPGDTGKNLYEYDFHNPLGHKIVRVSTGSAGLEVPAPGVLGVARVSADGSHVYFVAAGVLTEGMNAEGVEPTPGGANLYVFERDAAYPAGRVAFVGTLSEGDGSDWQAQDVRPVQATPDGRFLVFQSVADLTPGDVSSQSQVFEYDALGERLVRVSVGAAGYAAGAANADASGSSIPSRSFVQKAMPTPAVPGLAVSDDGSVVVFTSAGALTAGAEAAAAAGAASVYEYRSAGSIASGNVYLVSDAHSTSSAELSGMGASGGDVFFATPRSLLAQDVDTLFDVYDARVGGGFPAPVVPGVCEGAACQGALSGVPASALPGSVSGAGGGNLPPPPPVPAGGGGEPKVRPPSRAQRLAGALRVCRRERRARRVVCEARARKRYGVKGNGRGKGGR